MYPKKIIISFNLISSNYNSSNNSSHSNKTFSILKIKDRKELLRKICPRYENQDNP